MKSNLIWTKHPTPEPISGRDETRTFQLGRKIHNTAHLNATRALMFRIIQQSKVLKESIKRYRTNIKTQLQYKFKSKVQTDDRLQNSNRLTIFRTHLLCTATDVIFLV